MKEPAPPILCLRLVRLPSGVEKLIDSRCRATLGIVSNPNHDARKLRKAGFRAGEGPKEEEKKKGLSSLYFTLIKDRKTTFNSNCYLKSLLFMFLGFQLFNSNLKALF